MKKLLLLALAITVSISCGEDEPPENMNPVLVDCTYLRARIGTSFKNTFSDNSTITSIVLGTQFLDGHNFVILADQLGNSSFIDCDGDKFFITAKEVTAFNSDVDIRDVRLEFDLGAPIGEDRLLRTINNVTTLVGETTTQVIDYYGMVTATDQTVTVQGIEYNNVVEYSVRTFEHLENGPIIETTNSTYLFAPEVSAIKTESIRSADSTLIFRAELVEYVY